MQQWPDAQIDADLAKEIEEKPTEENQPGRGHDLQARRKLLLLSPDRAREEARDRLS